MLSTGYLCRILIKLEFSHRNLEKYSNIKFHEHPSSGSSAIPCGRTNGQADKNRKKLTDSLPTI